MTEYLLERYVGRGDAQAVAAGEQSARQAAEELSRRGTAVRYCRSIFVPSEETCFDIFEAESPLAVQEAAELAQLPYERVSAVAPGRAEHLPEEIDR
jgi:hypothetical protein